MGEELNKGTESRRESGLKLSLASWVLGSILLVFFFVVFFGVEALPVFKQRMLALACSLLAGVFTYFLTGDLKLKFTLKFSKFAQVAGRATGGVGAFLSVMIWWLSPLAPVNVQEQLQEIKENTSAIRQDNAAIHRVVTDNKESLDSVVAMMEKLLQEKQVSDTQPPELPEEARKLAQQIPDDAGLYARALKAIAQRHFDEALKLLSEAANSHETELVKIYRAQGDAKYYQGRYSEAIPFYEKAYVLNPDDPEIMNDLATALHFAGKYAEALGFFKSSLEARERKHGPDHPNVATGLNNLALLLMDQGKYAEAEPLYKRALEIKEKALGPDHPSVATGLNNLAELYRAQGKYAEAEPLYQRALEIEEKALGSDHPSLAMGLGGTCQR